MASPLLALSAKAASARRVSDMNGRVIYLSCPMTGIKDLNYPRFNHVVQMLREARYGENILNQFEGEADGE